MINIEVKTREELEDIIIQKQDFLLDEYTKINIESEKREDFYTGSIELKDYLRDTPQTLEKLKTKNIEKVLQSQYNDLKYSNLKEDEEKAKLSVEKCLQILKEREANGELIGSRCYSYPEEISTPMKNKISEKYNQILKNNPRICEIMSKNQSIGLYSAYSLVEKFQNGGFTQKEYELAEMLSKGNPQMNLNFECIDEELIEKFGMQNMYSICNKMELADTLINIKNNNKELLDYMAAAISLYDNSKIGERYNAIDSIIKFSGKNAFNKEIDFDDMKSIRDYINYSYFNHSIFSEGQYEKGGFRNNINEMCDEEYLNLKEKIQKDRKKAQESEYYSIGDYEIKSWKKDIYNIIFKKNFSMEYDDAKHFITSYGADLKFVEEKSKDKAEYNCLKSMIKINNVEDLDELLELYNNIDYNIDPIDMAHIDNNLNLMYSKTYEEKMAETTQKVKEITDSNESKTLNIDGKKVKMVELDGDFNLLVHSSNTGFVAMGANYEKKLFNNSYKYTWKYSPDRGSHVMSTTYINQNFMGMAPVSKGGVLYGFSNLKDEDIVTKGPTDINTFVNSFVYKASMTKNYTAENISSNTRRVYTEVGIEKEGLKPDYVIILDEFDEEMTEDSLKCAAEWDIPAIYINKEKIFEQQIQRLENKLEDYSKEESMMKLKDIINTFETNKAGWLLNRKEGKDESMTNSIDNSRFAPKMNEMELKIGELVKSEMCKMNAEQRAEMICFFKEEKEKYDFSEKISEKKISATEISKYIEEELVENEDEEKELKEKIEPENRVL